MEILVSAVWSRSTHCQSIWGRLKDKFNNMGYQFNDGSSLAREKSRFVAFGLLVLWSIALAELTRVPPTDIADLKQTVGSFAESMDSEDVQKAVHHLHWCQALACAQKNGA